MQSDRAGSRCLPGILLVVTMRNEWVMKGVKDKTERGWFR